MNTAVVGSMFYLCGDNLENKADRYQTISNAQAHHNYVRRSSQVGKFAKSSEKQGVPTGTCDNDGGCEACECDLLVFQIWCGAIPFHVSVEGLAVTG